MLFLLTENVIRNIILLLIISQINLICNIWVINMKYQQAIDFVLSKMKLGSKLGLDTITELLRRLGDPQKRLRFIHVAGTNGKGSTVSYIASILATGGYIVGKYTSPFLHNFAERIEVNGVPVSDDDFAGYITQISEVCGDTLNPTEFETITAAAFLHYVKLRCDIVVLEVGMGGRFDATNVIDCPDIAAITRIDLDHTALLGETVGEIAFEKCGIIKRGCEVVCYPVQEKEAMEVISPVALKMGCRVTMPDLRALKVLNKGLRSTTFSYKGKEYETPLLGEHQIYNALTAIEAVNIWGERFGFIQDFSIYKGISGVKIHGRFEILEVDGKTVVLDVGHNINGITALKEALLSYFPRKRVIVVMAMFEDKKYDICVSEMAEVACSFIATETDAKRVLPCPKIAAIARLHCTSVFEEPDRFKAYGMALSLAKPGDVVCVCGSFTLVSGLGM